MGNEKQLQGDFISFLSPNIPSFQQSNIPKVFK